MKFPIKDLFLRIWSHLLNKSLMENFIFCAVRVSCYESRKNLPAWTGKSLIFLIFQKVKKGGHSMDFVCSPGNFFQSRCIMNPIKRLKWIFF